MTAATHDFPAFEPHMKGPLTVSFVLHIVLVIIAIVGLPYFKPELPIIDTSITVELIDASDLAEMERPQERPEDAPRPEPVQKNEEPPKPVTPQVTAKTPPKPVAPAPPEKTEDIAPPEKDIAAPVKKPEPVKPKTPPKPVQRPELTKAEEPPQEKFNAVLKNLIGEEQEAVKPETPGEAKPAPASQPMNNSELGSLQAQLTQCWRLMAGARYAEDLIVDLTLTMAPDRTVRDVKIENMLRYNADSFFRAAADSARSAVYRCSPLDLPPNKYDQWKVLPVRFDPRSML